MKYFEVQDTPELKYAPQLKNWYGTFDVRDIRLETFPKLPDMQMFLLESSENTVFTDIILFPFLLISPMVLEVIKLYHECCFFRNVILLNPFNQESKLYYLPVFSEISNIQLYKKKYDNGNNITDMVIPQKEAISPDNNIFWVRDSKKRHIILSMDIAESLIRRGVTGLGLCEVELYQEN